MLIEGILRKGHCLIFPGAKINIGLYVTGKRPDGYHNLRTVMYPIPLHDVMEIWWEEAPENSLEIKTAGTFGKMVTDNVCSRVFHRFMEKMGEYTHSAYRIRMYLAKEIPVGAGLGGGSSNAVSFIKFLLWLFDVEETYENLAREVALETTADGDFFYFNKPGEFTGKGTLNSFLPEFLKGYRLCIVYPGIPSSTKEAYQTLVTDDYTDNLRISEILTQNSPEDWRERIVNIFEDKLRNLSPFIEPVKKVFYEHGALYASMSGSGSSIYGIFPGDFQKFQDVKKEVLEALPHAHNPISIFWLFL